MKPKKNTLNRAEVEKWLNNTFLFSIPALLAFLTALQGGNLQFALGAGYSALLASLIDLIKKYKEGK